MKKSIVVALILILMLTSSLSANAEIKVYVDGERIEDIQPIVVNNRTTVPVAVIAKNLEIDYTWDAAAQTVIFNQEGQELSLKIGEQNSFVQSGRTYVPLKYIAEAFGIEVDWREKEKAVMIGGNTNGVEKDEYDLYITRTNEHDLIIPVKTENTLFLTNIILSDYYKTSHAEVIEIIKNAVETNEEFSGTFDNRALKIKEVDGLMTIYIGIDETPRTTANY